MVLPTVPKVLLALVPRAVMAVMQTTMIRASITAYSTAVGPSSRLRNSATARVRFRMTSRSFEKKAVETKNLHPPRESPPASRAGRHGRVQGHVVEGLVG